jgi:lipopolysaccharide heptosyltransferase III
MPASLPPPASILVINVSRIGDTLLVTPAIRALARAWPQARITFLGHPNRVEILEHLPEVQQTRPITKTTARWRGRLRGRRFDLALVYGFDRPLVAYALRVARQVVAFRQDDETLDRRLFHCVDRPAFQSLHSAHIPLLLTRALNVPDAGLRLAYCVSQAERQWARATLATKLTQGARPLVGFQVASFPTKGYRDWPLERFAALAERMFASWPRAHLLLFGGRLDRNRTDWLAGRFPGRVTPLAGTVSLRRSAALMNELDLYVGVDTGPTHLMGALDTPMVALYHCYSPSRLLRPLERAHCYVVDHPRAAQGCGPETPMAEISVDTVWAKVVEALGAR